MRNISMSVAILALSISGLVFGASTEFTYQGQLRQDTLPANGSYDLKFALFDAVTAGNQISSTITLTSVTVTNGLFTVSLDYGVKSFSGADRWLEVQVQPAGGASYTTLTPRQKLTATPYALALPNLRTEASQNGPQFLSANIIGGSTVNTVGANVSGVVIAGGGATNGFPQTINSNYSVIGGGYSNTVNVNSAQSVIAGGVANSANSTGVTISGGQSNTGSASFATVGGGQSNTASGANSTIPGGFSNSATASTSFAAGNRAKAINAGSFVWGDSTSADVSSTANDQFMIRASNGVVLTANAGSNTAVAVGTQFRDNTVIAWGHVSGNGAIVDSFNITSVTHNGAGNYTVTMGGSVNGTSLAPVATPLFIGGTQPTTAATMRFATVQQLLSSTQFNVFINSGTFAATDNDFTFIVMGR